jgi:hypothetical protein
MTTFEVCSSSLRVLLPQTEPKDNVRSGVGRPVVAVLSIVLTVAVTACRRFWIPDCHCLVQAATPS